MIVVDTNVIVYLLLDVDRSDAAERVHTIDDEWVAPSLWRSEFMNVLTLFMRRRQLGLDACNDAMRAAEVIVTTSEYRIPSGRVLSQAMLSGCSAYDCEFVVLAQELGVRLVSADKKVLSSFPATAITPEAFVRLSS